MMARSPASLSIASPDRSPLVAPRGRLVDAPAIVKRFFTDAEGTALVTPRWVRDNMPHKIELSYSRVAWYDGDVQRVIDEAARTGVRLRDVRLTFDKSA
jgi:hypothetical protein